MVCEVADEGPGFPPQLLKSLFTPCRSTKGGSGIGLAISRQLANQLGAVLELAKSSPMIGERQATNRDRIAAMALSVRYGVHQ